MKEYLIYLAVMSLAADLVILCACLIPGRFSGKTGYGWRKSVPWRRFLLFPFISRSR